MSEKSKFACRGLGTRDRDQPRRTVGICRAFYGVTPSQPLFRNPSPSPEPRGPRRLDRVAPRVTAWTSANCSSTPTAICRRRRRWPACPRRRRPPRRRRAALHHRDRRAHGLLAGLVPPPRRGRRRPGGRDRRARLAQRRRGRLAGGPRRLRRRPRPAGPRRRAARSRRCRSRPAFEFPLLAGYTARDVWEHVGQHNAHHMGQVVILRQFLGLWPPPAGSYTW